MSFDDSVLNDLGINDNSGEKDDGFEKFLSKPIQRQYQPFGGPKPQTQSSIAEPQYAPPEPQPQPQAQPYHNFNDYDLDAYEQAKKQHSQISQYARENKKSASHYGSLYDDFKKKEFTPYFESMGGFGDFETDEEYISAIDEMYKSDLKNSQSEDGFFGASDAKLASQENLKKYASWNQPNGMRDKFLRLKAERDRRKATAEQAESMEYALFEQMTNIPIAQREALDASLKSRTAKPRSKKATDEMLNQMQFEDPVVDMVTGEVINLEKTDPRTSPPSAVNMVTGQRTPAAGKQAKRLEAAMRGDMAGFMSRRESVAKDRQLRDKGFMFSNGGQIDGRPIGMSRKDTDLLDLEEMKKAGMTEYKGQPIEQAIESLGGMERVKVAKVMQSVYAAKSNYEDVQLEYLKNSGGAKGDALREKMEAAREEVNKTIGLAAQFGLDNELFEQAETTGWLSAIGNAVKRGLLMSEMSNYTPDFLTNTLDADEMQKFIEIASEIEELPTSSTMKRVKSTKSDGPLDAIGNLLFDNPAAIPEMFVESMASFLPSAIKWMLPTAATGALAGSIIPGAGTAAGATFGARASWGTASFVLEASGMALEGMQELGIDWKNPKIFAAAWTNESIRNKIQKKMVQKGTPIAVADMLTGMMAGKVMAIANHTGNAMFKGGKLLNKTQFNKTAGAVPRFTKFQKTRNAAAELGADSLMGMSGEYLGQWASKEPGEDWDWDAIAAEGIVGVGPGVLSSALEMRSRSGNYFGNAPIEITGEQMTETGSMGTVTRAGYSAPYQTFNDAESMMGHLGTLKGVSPESLEFTRSFLEQMYAAKPEEMANLKIAFSPRTPDSNMENRGTFESRDGQNLMYINEEQFAADPMGAFMHESGHFARVFILSDSELMTLWDGLGSDAQLEAYAQYFTKKPDLSFDSLPENEQKKIRRAFDRTKRTAPDVLAEEWFSYQWGRVLNEQTADKNIASKLKSFKDGILKDALAPYIGTEDLAGSTKSEKNILNARILQFLGYENGMPTPKVPDEGGKPSSTTPQTKEQTQRKLNAMPGTPQEKSKIAKAVNAMLGADILTESPSFYSNMNRAAAVAASKDIEDIEKKKEDAETVADTLKESNLRRLEKKIAKRKKTDGYDAKDQPQDTPSPEELNEQQLREESGFQPKPKPEEISESPGGKELPKELGTVPREPQKSDGLFPTKPNSKAAQKRIKRAEKKEAQKAEIRKKRDAIRKAKQKETVPFRVDEIAPKDYEKPRASRTFDTPAPKLGTEQDKLNQRTPSKNNTTASVNPKATSRSEQEILKLDKILPKTKEELDQIRDLKDQLSENQAKFDSVVSLDKAIEAAVQELAEEGSPSITQIISKVLNLETLLKLSPISFVSEIEKAMNPTASRSKVPSSKDIEDMATEARERIEDIKELLNLRLAEIDREIASLEKSPAAQPQPAAGWQKSTAPTPAKVFAGIGSRALPPSAQKEVAKLFNQKGQSKPSKVHSGSAKGSDYLFEMLAVKAGIAVEAHTFEGHRGTAGDPANFKKHSQEELNKADSALKKANETLGRTFPAKDQHTNNLLRRNYYQVVDSDQIIAFAPLLNGLVQGGTGWAVQMAIDMGKEVHIFDTNTAQWFSWPQPAAQGQGPKVRYLGGVKAVNEAEAKGEGVSTLRKAGEQHFGNPFSHLDNSRDTTKTGTRTEAVEKYKQWLAGTDFKNVKQERRKWVIDQIESGALEGKDLLYYTKQQPNHAEALAQFIASKGQGPNAGAQAEITELQSKRKLVKMYLHFIAPEEASVDWKDVPHNLMTYRRYKMVKGNKVYSPEYSKFQPVTYGMLASMKDWQFKDDKSTEYPNIEYKVSRQERDKTDLRSPQEYLWDYVNHEFKPPPVSDKDKAEIGKPFYGGLTENQYRMKLEAIKASAMFTKQQDIGKEPMGSARWEVENDIKQEARRGYPSGFTTERGANFGAVIAERIRQKGLSGKVKSDGTKAYANFDLETLEPTITDVVALMMANGRTLELLGDPSDSMKDFDHMLFVIAREEMKSKLLGEKDKGGVPSDLENQFEYAEEDGDPFIKVQPGATLAKTLLGVLSTKARLKFERDYLDYIVENTQLSDSTSTKLNLEMSKEGMRLDSLSGDNPKVALEKLGEYLDSIKEKRGVDVRGKLVPIPRKVQKSLTEAYELLRARVDNEKYLSDQLNGHTIEVIGGVSKPQSKTVSKFRVKPEDVYDFRRPLSRTSENIPAKGDHGAFTAGDMYKTFDVMTAFSKRRESPELVADMIMGASTGFEKERTNVGKSETLPNNPINMDRAEADLLSSTDISAVDLANWYLGAKGSEVKRMADLQMTPSSKDNKQLPGGLGEGLLPYVFRDFITAMYENLNIKDLDLKIKDAESDKTFDWTYTEGRMMMGGELVDFNMFTDKEGMMHPEVMEALTRPIVQAVLDAEGIDVYDQFDANSENILQRDTQKAESFDKDDSAEMQTEADDTDSGAQTSKVEVNPVEQESLNQFQNDKRQELGVDPDPVNKNPVEKPITLSDLVKSNLKDKTPEEIKAFTDDSMTDSFKQAQLAENIKEFEETFTPKKSKSKNRTLNSDAGKQEMPMSPLNVYRSTDADFGFEEDFRLETTVGQELKKLGIKVDKNGVPYTDNKVAIKKGFPMILYRGVKYNPKTKTTGRPAEGVFFTREFETAEAYANGYKMSGNYEADMKAMDSYRDELKANGEKLIVFSYLYQSPGNSMTKKAGIAPKQKELTVGTMEGPEDYNAMLEFGEYTFGSGTGERSYVLKTSQLSGLDGLLAAHEINADSSINEDGSTPKLIPFNEIPQNGLNPRELDKFEREDTERNLQNRTLNSDATLTSDVNPNLAKANLLSRIAGDSELKKNFEEWLKDKKDSELAGSFMMSFVDQADPLKKVHRSLFETLKAAGMDITKGPMRSLYNMLNVHGKWHQYFGKGYDTVEQARIQYIQPIKDAMLKYGIDQGTFGNYLLARAAPSRNQHLRDKVKRLQKEAEGLTGTERQTALKDIQEVYLNEDGTIKDSGISDQAAYNLITEYENNSKTGANFVNFLNEALDPYYNMNKESISMLREASMIRESTQLDGVQEGLSEYDRMVGAMSKIDLANPNSDFNFAGSKVKLSDPKYSYSPMQGFEGETEAFFDAERAWEELGKGQNSSGKGWDQPKSELLRDPAFGRVKGTRGPNPDSVLANAINQFFDSAIRSHKNEVSRSFGEMFQLMRSIAYPDRENPYEPNDPELKIAYGQMSKLPEEQKKKIKEEFDEIFEQDFNETSEKNTLKFDDEYVTDGNTGEFVAKRKTLNAKFKQDPLVFVYRVNGTPMFIKFKNTTKGTRMARSMKNLKYESLPSVLKYFNKITRFMAQMFTSMNPAFIIPNFFRDLGTAFIHLTEDDKKKLVKDVFKFKNLKWIKSIAQAELYISQGKGPMKALNIKETERLKGQTEAQYAQAILKRGNKIEMYAYAKRNGAKIGYVRHDTVPELIRNIKKETGKSEGATKRRLKNVLSYVDAANTGVENSVRMSTFWAAIKNGYTPQESATMSRNITVDFNQKGELTQAFGSLYVFFGAAVNSTHRFMTTLNRRSPAERATLIGGIATASFLVATFNRLMDDDEDEAVPDYDTISSYKRDTNLIMPIPAGLPGFFNDKKDTGYFSMPLPLGYNLFWSMGQVVADTFANNYGGIRGGSGVMEGANRLLESSMNAFNPVGGASIATIGTPTFVTPIIELWANKNFMGREIRYKDDQFGVPEPGHMQDPKSTPAHWNALSKGLNEFFGGNDVIKGSLSGAFGAKNPLMYDQDSDIKFDISGNQFKHMFYGYLGGPGQLLDTAFGGLFSAVKGKASIDNVGQVPIINRFMRGTTYGSHTRELYYNLRDTVKTAESAVKDAKKISPKAYSLVNNDLRPLLSINSQLKAFEAQKNKFSRLKSKVESASNLTDAQKTQRIADIEEKELNMMVKVIKKAQSLGIS